jgi:hypothetical protein
MFIPLATGFLLPRKLSKVVTESCEVLTWIYLVNPSQFRSSFARVARIRLFDALASCVQFWLKDGERST